eukprot:jgi/Botrbrau1/20032/Bobra.200_1s0037.1
MGHLVAPESPTEQISSDDGVGAGIPEDEDSGAQLVHDQHETRCGKDDALQHGQNLDDAIGAVESAKSNLYNCQAKLLEKVRMWGFPPITEEFVKRWTITRNRSGNYHYQTPGGRKYTSRDAVRDLLNDMQKAGKFEPGAGLPLAPGRPDVWTNGVKACLSWRADTGMADDTAGDVREQYALTSRPFVRKAIAASRARWQGSGEAETNLWSQQKKLLEHISGSGFPPEVVTYVKTWRIVAIGPHEYNYVLPRGIGKVRSMKAAVQKLRELQESNEKLQQELEAIPPGRTVFILDKNHRPCLIWERNDARISPESINSDGSPGAAVDHAPSHIVHRPTPVLPRQGFAYCFASGNLDLGRLTPPATGPVLPGLLPPFSAPTPQFTGPSPLGNGGLISPQPSYQPAFQSFKRGGSYPDYRGIASKRPHLSQDYNPLLRPSPSLEPILPPAPQVPVNHNLGDPHVMSLLAQLFEYTRQRDLTLYEKEVAALKEDCRTKDQQLSTLREELNERATRMSDLMKESSVLKSTLEALHTPPDSRDLLDLRTPTHRTNGDLDREESAALQGRVNILTNKLVETQGEVKRQREEIAALRKENDHLKDRVFEMELGIPSGKAAKVSE